MQTFRDLNKHLGMVPSKSAAALSEASAGRGREEAFRRQNPQVLAGLMEVALIQSSASSNAILFSIRCYMLPLVEIARVVKWRRRLHRVLRDLDPALVEYKGMARYRDMAVGWLSQFDDGAPLAPGIAPDQRSL